MQWYELFLVGGVLAVLSWLLVLGVRRQAERHRILDIPNERSSHSRPVARGGGLAIAVICVIGWFVLLVCWPDENRFGMACFAGGAVMIAGISILDDIHTVSSAVRFAVHGAAAVLLLLGYGDWRIVSLPFVGEFCIGWLGVPLDCRVDKRIQLHGWNRRNCRMSGDYRRVGLVDCGAVEWASDGALAGIVRDGEQRRIPGAQLASGEDFHGGRR
jgi:hypothetical protein